MCSKVRRASARTTIVSKSKAPQQPTLSGLSGAVRSAALTYRCSRADTRYTLCRAHTYRIERSPLEPSCLHPKTVRSPHPPSRHQSDVLQQDELETMCSGFHHLLSSGQATRTAEIEVSGPHPLVVAQGCVDHRLSPREPSPPLRHYRSRGSKAFCQYLDVEAYFRGNKNVGNTISLLSHDGSGLTAPRWGEPQGRRSHLYRMSIQYCLPSLTQSCSKGRQVPF